MDVKLKKEGFQCSSLAMWCWHINEKIHLPVSVDIQKLLHLNGKTCFLKIDHDKNHLSLELQQPHEKKQLAKPNQLECGLDDDNVYQHVDTINSYHNVNLTTWRL
jgi:hypothetical protein